MIVKRGRPVSVAPAGAVTRWYSSPGTKPTTATTNKNKNKQTQ
jgi:hypothetical protein